MSCRNCGPRCTCDHSTECPQLPSTIDIDDVREILSQAMFNMAKRIAAVLREEMDPEEAEEVNRRLVEWLTVTFSGGNSRYQSSEEWNPEGLAALLRERLSSMLANVPDDDEEMLRVSFTYLASQMQAAILSAEPDETGEAMPATCRAVVDFWSLLLTGAPDEFFS